MRIPVVRLSVMKIETKAIHVGREPEAGSRDVTPAIHLSTTFQKAEDGSLPGGYLYSRPNNPNRAALEEVLASLEEGAAALAFSSGNAATASLFQALAPRDEVIAGIDVFYCTAVLLHNHLRRAGMKARYVDMRDLAAVERAVTPKTKLIWVETPSHPLPNITDIRHT